MAKENSDTGQVATGQGDNAQLATGQGDTNQSATGTGDTNQSATGTSGNQEHMIPKSRLDEINNRMKTAEETARYYQQQLQIAMANKPKGDNQTPDLLKQMGIEPPPAN